MVAGGEAAESYGAAEGDAMEGGGDAQTRSLLYRAVTRAQLMAIVVNEMLPGGWLEFLTPTLTMTLTLTLTLALTLTPSYRWLARVPRPRAPARRPGLR